MPAVVTIWSRQRRMMDWYNLPYEEYMTFGRRTPWPDEKNPPIPTGYETEVEDMIGAVHVEQKWFVKPYTNPTDEEKRFAILYRGLYYQTFTVPEDAIAAGCTAIMLRVILDAEEFPLEDFRQVGLRISVQSTQRIINQIESQEWDKVAEKGTLEAIDNRKVQTRAEDQQEEVYILMEF